jgi:hypothetical protein
MVADGGECELNHTVNGMEQVQYLLSSVSSKTVSNKL